MQNGPKISFSNMHLQQRCLQVFLQVKSIRAAGILLKILFKVHMSFKWIALVSII